MKKRRWLLWLGTNLCRLLLSVTFLFSGVVKLIDPRGTQYKIEDYAAAFGMYDMMPQGLALLMSVVLAMMEFYIGFNLFFGIRRRTTSRIALALLCVLTPVTLYLAMTDAVADCGCFGDAVKLTNWQTFWKNVVLMVSTIVVMLNYRRVTRFITERNQWMLSIYGLVFAIFLAIYNIHYLPVIDFRPYSIGTDLPKAIEDDFSGVNDEPRYMDFIIQTLQGEDITMEWLQLPGYKFLLVAPWVEKADDASADKVNAVYDYCREQGYPFLAVTSSLEENIDRWKDLTGAEYDFAQADGTMLKTVIRSNPGLLLLRDGVIYNKWSCNNLPDEVQLSRPLEGQRIGQMQQRSRIHSAYRLLLWFTLPLLFFTLIDRIWVGNKFYRRHRRKAKGKS